MEPLFAMLLIAAFVAVVCVCIQGRVAHRSYGILTAVLVEVAIGIAAIWAVSAWIEVIISDLANPGPVGFGAMMLGGFAMLSVSATVVLNMISGALIWRLTREG